MSVLSSLSCLMDTETGMNSGLGLSEKLLVCWVQVFAGVNIRKTKEV